ncbi:adenine-specific DNA-methyltransferase [Staphylococcus hominis]|uniref:site-specific DNA-methyltransferase n=1 Tax=Staphylococcus TaxID=1279 RepID=UPI0008A9CB8B|nr:MULTISPECIES: site-specific DNA-methyltransferase [Staphylococcus]MBC3059768.1 site-specific DNA-methyltransferase [Staphylococcus hominis]MCM3475003.1 site-specific DNA-methyltransferase [Staphylococcus hominis]MDK8623362.1 site-specific DNA-methyltransferase [Staphylococcus epidermidis]OHO57864.1 type III restriction endonuclease subunit M [Staphylococcus sp. HMSC035F02]
MKTTINKEIEKILKQFGGKYFIGNNINKSKIIQDLDNYNSSLIKAFIINETIKKYFTIEIENNTIFKVNNLIELFENNEYWKDSYTRYSKKIGLTVDGEFINESNDVVLDFPYKDTVLKASMSKEDTDKNDLRPDEPFLNEIIAKEEIDVLLDKKILVNAKKFNHKDGSESRVTEYNDENLLIKGNNLISLHTISHKFSNYFDVIYIDPPYNVKSSNNTFVYNNNFSHASWLTFMKNRLEIAQSLLKQNEGVLIIAIDENEVNYLGVLIDELFINYESHLITVVHNPRGIQGTNFSYTHEYLYFVFPKGKKLIQDRILEDNEISLSNLRNWGGESERGDGKNTFFSIQININTNEVIGFGDVLPSDVHPNQTEIQDEIAFVYPIDSNGIERKWRYARQTIEGIKEMLYPIKKSNNHYEVMIGKNFGQYKTVWQSPRYDASIHGKQLLKKLVPSADFSFPKSVYAVYDALYAVIKNKKDAKVLDFFSGSGTTAHAVQMLNKRDDGNRKYIMIEQMPYIKTTQIKRLLAEDEAKKNDDFIYVELMEKNRGFIKSIQNAQSWNEIYNVFSFMLEEAEIDFRADLEEIKETLYSLTLIEQKRLLIQIIDKNQLYYNYSEIDDENVKDLINNEDYQFNNSFYEKGDN